MIFINAILCVFIENMKSTLADEVRTMGLGLSVSVSVFVVSSRNYVVLQRRSYYVVTAVLRILLGTEPC